MSLQPSKYKVFTKQVYNHLIDDHGDRDLTVGFIMSNINIDDLLKLLLKNVSRIEKVEIAFMVYFMSKTNDVESSFSKVRGNLINLGMSQYSDLGTRDETCHECNGSGSEYCSTCDGSGDVQCNRCDGNGTEECRNCDGSGEVDGEPCSDCQGYGQIECSWCDGEGDFQCESCDGYGSVDCDYCDGAGDYESSEEYYTEYEIDYFGLNPELKSLPKDEILTNDLLDIIFNSEPKLLDHNEIDNKVESDAPCKQYYGDCEGDPLTVINNIYEID